MNEQCLEARRRNEIFFLIARFLEDSSCRRAAKVLIEELEEKELLFKGKEWSGEETKLTFEEISKRNVHISSDYLLLLCNELCSQLESSGSIRGGGGGGGGQSLIGNEISSFIYNKNKNKNNNVSSSLLKLTNQKHHFTTDHLHKDTTLHLCTLLHSTRLSSIPSMASLLVQPINFTKMKKHTVILGHLAPVFCLSFDSTGQRIITGADDDLAKIWSTSTGQLVSTLRGHHAEITDLSVSWDNTLIATGSLDKLVRVWCGHTSAPVAVLTGHSGHITSVQLSPSPDDDSKYIATTAKDGCLLFWKWDPLTLKFHDKPVKFMEKNRVSDQTLCSAFSPGGKFYVTGGTDKIVRVYEMSDPPLLVNELTGHTDRILTIQFNNNGQCCFATGSCDGTSIIWRYSSSQWNSIVLVASVDQQLISSASKFDNKTNQVTMICWERLSDSYLATGHTPDCNIRIWNTSNGEMVSLLKGHTNEVFVVECHPKEPRILLTAGHDGQVIIWDMLAAVQLKVFQIEYEDEGVPCIFDCKWSPDGLTVAAADIFGYLTIFGFGSSTPYEQHPEEQFFHTDYRPLMRDRNNYVVDEQTQLPPHLLPPPYLVDIDGHPYPVKYQESILKYLRTGTNAHSLSADRSSDDTEDYDEYMRKHFVQFDKERKTFQERNRRLTQPTAPPTESDVTPSLLGVVAPPTDTSTNDTTQDNSVPDEVVDIIEGDGGDQNIQNMLSSIVYSLGLDEGETLVAISNWHKRNILPTIDSATISSEQARLYELRSLETEWIETESNKIIQLPTPVPSPPTPEGRSLRSGRTIDTREFSGYYEYEEGEGERGGVSPPVHEGDSDSDALIDEGWDTGSTASSDISDWANEAGPYNPSLSNNRTRKNRRRESTVSEIPSELTIDEEERQREGGGGGGGGGGRVRRAVRSGVLLSSSTNTSSTTAGTDTRPTDTKHTVKKVRKGFDYSIYWPTDWLKMSTHQVSPYYPQVGDIVVYCYQGHVMYRDEVKKQRPYVWKNQLLPHQKHPLMRPQEYCLVNNVHFVVGPPTLCSITLTLLSTHSVGSDVPSTSTQQTNKQISFTFKYHDMDGVVDFLILDSIYKTSVQTQWSNGSTFKSLIDNQYYTGTVLKKEPLDEALPHSYWQCYQVKWDDGPTDRLSPWDMELPSSSLPPSSPSLSLPPSQSWGEGERERILKGLETIMEEMEEAELFKEPVNLEEELVYCTVVPLPTDLRTICNRLNNGFYRRKLSLLWEVVLLSRNASQYNEVDSIIVNNSKVLTQTLVKFINTPDCVNPMSCYSPLDVLSDEYINANDDQITADIDQETEVFLPPLTPPPAPSSATPTPVSPDRPVRMTRKRTKRLISEDDDATNAESANDTSWILGASRLIDDISSHPDSYPFMEPVDTSLYTDYLKVIKHPMDLSTVQDKLFKGTYDNCSSFLQDMNLIFNNAKEYNQTKSEVYKMAVTLQNTLNEQSKSCLGITPDHTHHYNTRKALERIAGTLSSIDNSDNLTGTTPSRIKTTPATNDDEEEEEEEEEGVTINNEGTSDVTSERHSDVSYTREEEEEEERFEYLEEKEEEGNARVTRSRSKVMIQEQLEIDSDQEEEEEEEEGERVRRSKRRRTLNKSKRNKRRKIEIEDDFDDDVPVIRTRAGRVTYKKHRYS